MAMTDPPLPDVFENKVRLRCEAKVGEETVWVQQEIVQIAYDFNPEFRNMVHETLRRALMEKILERWTPVIRIRRDTPTFP